MVPGVGAFDMGDVTGAIEDGERRIGNVVGEEAPEMMPAEDVGPIVVRGIRENRLHIFTHPAALPLAERRFDVIRADFEAEARSQGLDAKTRI